MNGLAVIAGTTATVAGCLTWAYWRGHHRTANPTEPWMPTAADTAKARHRLRDKITGLCRQRSIAQRKGRLHEVQRLTLAIDRQRRLLPAVSLPQLPPRCPECGAIANADSARWLIVADGWMHDCEGAHVDEAEANAPACPPPKRLNKPAVVLAAILALAVLAGLAVTIYNVIAILNTYL